MFPGVNGFHWTFGHILFVTVFCAALVTIGVAVLSAALRTSREMRAGRAEGIRWHAAWQELPERDRRCRHDIAGQVIYRVCPNEFDCRACSDHPRFGPPAGEAGDEHYGLRYPANRLYHRGHTWVEPQQDGTLTIGLDEIAHRLIGRPDWAELPALGAALVNSGNGWHMRKDGVRIRVLAPLDGEVVETGGPEQEWYLRVKPRTTPPDFRHLLSGAEVPAWVGRELQRLQMLMMPRGSRPSLADGGVLMHELIAHQPSANWDTILGEVFLDP